MLNKIIKLFEEINQYEIMETYICILSNYRKELSLLKQTFDLIMKNLGDLDFENYENENILQNIDENNNKSDSSKRTITKTVVLPDGTYGTVTEVLDVKEKKIRK